jgi:hypothetical protein
LSDGLLLQQSHRTEASVGEERLVHCDPIDQATTRRLLRPAAVARSTPRTEGLLALARGLLLLIGTAIPAISQYASCYGGAGVGQIPSCAGRRHAVDGDGNRKTPSHVVKKGTRYRYYVSRPLITTAKSP